MTSLKVATLQQNPTVGAIADNIQKILKNYNALVSAEPGLQLIVASEGFISGYPFEDLGLKRGFVREVFEQTMDDLVPNIGNTALYVGAPWPGPDHVADGNPWHQNKPINAGLLIRNGKIEQVVAKVDLPNYGVFDEVRIFQPGTPAPIYELDGVKLGLMVCADFWEDNVPGHFFNLGADLFVVINGSPWELDKTQKRETRAQQVVEKFQTPVVYVNQIGGQDELVFDGGSFVALPGGIRGRTSQFAENGTVFDLKLGEDLDIVHARKVLGNGVSMTAEEDEKNWAALVLGLRDYVEKNGFRGVLIGESGGIDSAFSTAVAIDALGPDRVVGVTLPSSVTSGETMDFVEQLRKSMGIRIDEVSIREIYEAVLGNVSKGIGDFQGKSLTKENIQSRARGLTLMTISNDLGLLTLCNGNKSELSTGYFTIYGDSVGGFNVVKDLYKTDIWRLAEWRNENTCRIAVNDMLNIIPDGIVKRPPTAELIAGQKDTDSLPDYPVLDTILRLMVDSELTTREIADMLKVRVPEQVSRYLNMEQISEVLGMAGVEDFREVVRKVRNLVDRAEWKRRQGPPGIKMGDKAYGRDRRYPITNKFHDEE